MTSSGDTENITHFCSTRTRAVLLRGYARATGKVGVALVTSGPGATNAVTGIATAYMDSIPLVVITGQVPSGLIGTDAFQEVDTFGITLPVVKHSYLVRDVSELEDIVNEAFFIAASGKPGPVVIDIPKDITGEVTEYRGRSEGFSEYHEYRAEPDAEVLETVVEKLLAQSSRFLYWRWRGDKRGIRRFDTLWKSSIAR